MEGSSGASSWLRVRGRNIIALHGSAGLYYAVSELRAEKGNKGSTIAIEPS